MIQCLIKMNFSFQIINPLPQEIPKCKALYDFYIEDENEKDCLAFSKVHLTKWPFHVQKYTQKSTESCCILNISY